MAIQYLISDAKLLCERSRYQLRTGSSGYGSTVFCTLLGVAVLAWVTVTDKGRTGKGITDVNGRTLGGGAAVGVSTLVEVAVLTGSDVTDSKNGKLLELLDLVLSQCCKSIRQQWMLESFKFILGISKYNFGG